MNRKLESFAMVKLFLSWTNKWLFNQMLLWQSGEQSAIWIKHQYNGQRRVRQENLAQKCAGTIRKKVDSVFLHQREKNESHTLSDRQQGSLSLPFENGMNNKRTYDQINKKNLALSSKWQYTYHCRITAFSSEHSSQQKIKEKASSSKWLLHPKVFVVVSWQLGFLTINLFASCLSHQPLQYIAWHFDPYS